MQRINTTNRGQGDVLLYNTNDGGEIAVTDGVVGIVGDLRTAVYLSLFGGQSDWWGDLSVADPDFHNTSETAELSENIALVPVNLLRIEDVVRRDLQWMVNQRIVSNITVTASILDTDVLGLSVSIQADGQETDFEFVENWNETALINPVESPDAVPEIAPGFSGGFSEGFR